MQLHQLHCCHLDAGQLLHLPASVPLVPIAIAGYVVFASSAKGCSVTAAAAAAAAPAADVDLASSKVTDGATDVVDAAVATAAAAPCCHSFSVAVYTSCCY